ncbi:MAG: hypothetical protein EBW15_10240 [Actinobacteria bacterium]|nr:hypothetical protein [Actinomycetota bacterium]
METDDLRALIDAQWLAMATDDLQALTTSQWQSFATDDLQALTTAQWQSLATDDVSALIESQWQAMALDDLKALSSTQWRAVETTDLGALSAAQWKAMETVDLQGLSTAQWQGMSPEALQALTATQWSAMATDDVMALSATQWGSVSNTSKNAYADARKLTRGNQSPLVLDLEGDGLSLLGVNRGIRFDLDGDGWAEQTGWVDGADALLVLDRNGDGRISSGRELFGDASVDGSGERYADGFAALGGFDADGNGRIDAADPVYGDLRLWQDLNADGESEATELTGLAAAGVVSIALGAQTVSWWQAGHEVRLQSSYEGAQGTMAIVDIWFEVFDDPNRLNPKDSGGP